MTTKLLWFATTRIGNQQGTIIGNQQFLNLLLGGLIDILLVEGHDSLGDGLTDGVDLGSVTSSTHSNANIESSDTVSAQKQNGLIHLGTQDFWLDEGKRSAVELDESLAALAHCNSRGRLLLDGHKMGITMRCDAMRCDDEI